MEVADQELVRNFSCIGAELRVFDDNALSMMSSAFTEAILTES